ncbi:hypothetical protein THH46_27210 [Pseudomonas sp. NA13]
MNTRQLLRCSTKTRTPVCHPVRRTRDSFTSKVATHVDAQPVASYQDLAWEPRCRASQLLIATHSPLVAASLEPVFDEEQDDQIQLSIQDHKVTLTQGHWAAQGDASSWLVSDTFGLEQARSLEAEKAIEAAEAFMRGEKQLPEGLKTRASIHRSLQKLLPAHDEFWPRWLIESGLLTLNGEGNQ